MVEPKLKKWSYFTAFILPCLVLYILFFISPFFNGIGISLTNWDGLTQKVPMILSKTEFEEKILSKIQNQKDKDYILDIYYFDENDNSYHRRALRGLKKYKTEKIIKKTKYEPENYKFVGFENYKKIFTGKGGKDFYPSRTTIYKYNKTSDLPLTINQKEFEKEILKRLEKLPKEDSVAQKSKDIITSAYVLNTKTEKYQLKSEFDEFYIEQPLYELPEYLETKQISDSELDVLIRQMENFALENKPYDLHKQVLDFSNENSLSEKSKDIVFDISNDLLEIAKLKNVLSQNWYVSNFKLGVIGFTLFFAFFSVIGINVVAFGLALALDTGIKGQKILRTIFFLPNVLSMIIVALIWNMLFVQFLPAITGIEKWMSDSNKAPWLLVLVAVWQGSGYYMIVYLAGLQNIPTEIIEAAKIDGASTWQRFKNITIPMMMPSITVCLFLTIANALKSFDLMYAMVGPTGYATGTVPLVYDIYFQAYSMKESGMATAKAMVLFLAIVIVTGIQLFSMKRKEIEA